MSQTFFEKKNELGHRFARHLFDFHCIKCKINGCLNANKLAKKCEVSDEEFIREFYKQCVETDKNRCLKWLLIEMPDYDFDTSIFIYFEEYFKNA